MNLTLRTLAAFPVVFLLAAPMVLPAAGQERPVPVAELAAGALMFPDDSLVTEGFFGGAVRFHVLPRISIGPEIAYVRGTNHSHLVLTGNVTFDFLAPVNGRPRPVTPFAVVGGGVFRTRESFPNDETFASGEGAFTAGGGGRVRIGDHVLAGVEARIGWELHLRLNALVGVRLGGS